MDARSRPQTRQPAGSGYYPGAPKVGPGNTFVNATRAAGPPQPVQMVPVAPVIPGVAAHATVPIVPSVVAAPYSVGPAVPVVSDAVVSYTVPQTTQEFPDNTQFWQSNPAYYQWELQRMRQELEKTYSNMQNLAAQSAGSEQVRNENAQLKARLQQATDALAQLREAEMQYKSISEQQSMLADPNNLLGENIQLKSELSSIANQNTSLSQAMQFRHRQAWVAWQKLRSAEDKWHNALKDIENQQRTIATVSQQANQLQTAHADVVTRLRAADAEVERLRAAEAQWQRDAQDLAYHRQMLQSANEEVGRLRNIEATLTSANAEVQYLRQHVAHLKSVDGKFAEVCREADMLRQHVAQQESNIDIYADQTRKYFLSASEEVAALRHQVQGLAVAEAEIVRLRKELEVASGYYTELQYARTQLADARSQIDQLSLDLEKLSKELNFVRGQLVQQTEKARIATEEVDRIASDRTCSVLSDQLVEAEREIIRLRNMIGENRLEIDRHRSACEQLKEELVHSKSLISQHKTELEQCYGDQRAQREEIAGLRRAIDEFRLKSSWTMNEAAGRVYHTEVPAPPRMAMAGTIVAQPGSMNRMVMPIGAPINVSGAPVATSMPLFTTYEPSFDMTTVSAAVPAPASPPRGQKSDRKFAFFGVEVADGVVLAQQYGEPNPIPAVKVINSFGPCAAAGIQPGDLISSINGKQVATLYDFNQIVSTTPPKSEVKIVFERNGVLLGSDVLTEETPNAPGSPSQGR